MNGVRHDLGIAGPAAAAETGRRSRTVRGRLVIALAPLLVGCGYVVGNPFPQQIRSVHVPTFRNDTYRRGYELLLTEAVQKQIQLRTPFRLARADEADTVLTGQIRTLNKRLTNQTRQDDPRELELQFGVEVRWQNARTGELLGQQMIPVSAATAHILTSATFTPETGQSLATATQEAVDQVARQVVGLMESPW